MRGRLEIARTLQPRSGYECQENMQGFKTFEEKGYKNSPQKLFRFAASGQNRSKEVNLFFRSNWICLRHPLPRWLGTTTRPAETTMQQPTWTWRTLTMRTCPGRVMVKSVFPLPERTRFLSSEMCPSTIFQLSTVSRLQFNVYKLHLKRQSRLHG